MIEKISPGTDFFAVLSLPRKLQIDGGDLERRYHALSRQFHPDFYQRAAARDRLTRLENSALVNKAYRTLRDPVSRAEYLVWLGMGEGGAIKADAPHDLFEEILELNELLVEYQTADPNEQSDLQLLLKEQKDRF